MNNKLLSGVFIGFLLLSSFTSVGRDEQSTSKWVLLNPDTCYTYKHNLNYTPWDVHAWVSLVDEGGTPAIPYHEVKGLTLENHKNSITLCNESPNRVNALITTH